MRIFVTGATGFIGSAIVSELLGAGHAVLGLARSDAKAAALAATGAKVHRGSLEDPDSLRRGAAAADGVIHTAFIHDFANLRAAAEADLRAIAAFGEALAGTGRPLIVTSGIAHLKPGRLATEDEAPDPRAALGHRTASEAATLALAARGVRAAIVRLPPSVHGEGDHAFVPALIAVAREKRVSAHVGEGLNRWSAVHRLDAARLFRLAAESGTAGARYHGIGDEAVPLREIAAVIGRRLALPVVAVSPAEAAGHFGWLAPFLAFDCPASSAMTQAALGWRPTQPGLIADLEEGSYFDERGGLR
jgi:nucleoside-diphosphate-sugar epimerase